MPVKIKLTQSPEEAVLSLLKDKILSGGRFTSEELSELTFSMSDGQIGASGPQHILDKLSNLMSSETTTKVV